MSRGQESHHKARRYLLEHRIELVLVSPMAVLAKVRGDGVRHQVAWSAGQGWSCTCPSTSPTCSHRLAVGHVVVVEDCS